MTEKNIYYKDFSNTAPNSYALYSSDEELVDVFMLMEAWAALKRGHKVVYKRIGIIKYSGIITKGTKKFAENYTRMLPMKLMQQFVKTAATLQRVKVDLSCALNVIHVVIARRKENSTSLEIILFR